MKEQRFLVTIRDIQRCRILKDCVEKRLKASQASHILGLNGLFHKLCYVFYWVVMGFFLSFRRLQIPSIIRYIIYEENHLVVPFINNATYHYLIFR